MERTIKRSLSFGDLTLKITDVGEDLHLLLTGGEKPHLGCTVLAIPRPSLTGSKKTGVKIGRASCRERVFGLV